MRLSVRAAAVFALLLAVMTFHEAEHVVQLWQKDVAEASCPNDCRGLLGFAFDLEWIHFAYNGTILLALAAIVGFCRLWRTPALAGALALQGYHVIEHVEKLAQWFANGGHSPTPGHLGQHVPLVELHFAFNTAVYLLVIVGFLDVGAHRRLWTARTPMRVAAASALALFAVGATAAAWSQRPPTVRLAAGVHAGPLVLDRAQRLVGEPGTVVRGGIRITADDVVVRDVAVLGGENGIEVQFSVGRYDAGDYWLIPAREANASVEWPAGDGPEPQPPRRIVHGLCPLAEIEFDAKRRRWEMRSDRRIQFAPLARRSSARPLDDLMHQCLTNLRNYT